MSKKIQSQIRNLLLLSGIVVFIYIPLAQADVEQVTDEFFIDGVVGVVFGQEDTQIITHSDVRRHSLDGKVRSYDDIVFERLLYLDACKHKIVDEEAVDKYLAVVQRQNNLTSEQLRHVFESAGYTYIEGREQFKMMHAAGQMIGQKVQQSGVVSRKEVERYFKEHPEKEEAVYTVQRAVVPFDMSVEKTEQAFKITPESNITWLSSFKIKESEIAPNLRFIVTMLPSEVSKPVERPNGFEVYRLVAKQPERERTLTERYSEIATHVRMERSQQALDNYRKSLFVSAGIATIQA